MAEDKLETLRQLAQERQLALGIELQRLRSQRQEQEAQAESLREMLSSYRSAQQMSLTRHAAQLAMFQRFYARVTQTLSAHGTHMEKLRHAEWQGEVKFHEAYREHKAISRLQETRAARLALLRKRKERRSDGARRWSMLNRSDDEREF